MAMDYINIYSFFFICPIAEQVCYVHGGRVTFLTGTGGHENRNRTESRRKHGGTRAETGDPKVWGQTPPKLDPPKKSRNPSGNGAGGQKHA